MVRRGPMTAAEHLRQLEADPEWVARRDARDRDLAERSARARQEEHDLLADLATVGLLVDSVWALYKKRPYPAALLILMLHLTRSYSEHLLEGIARAMAVKEARDDAWDFLIEQLKRKSLPKNAADGAMSAISAMARPADLPTLISLIRNRALGSQRLFLVSNLMRSKRPEARETLVQLRDDSDLRLEITARLDASDRKAKVVKG